MKPDTKKLSKKDLINAVYDNTALTKKSIEQVVNEFIEVLLHEIEQGNEVRIHELGTFSSHQRAGRTARNPRTGEEVYVPEKRVPKLTFNQAIAKRMNGA